ncbi:hypothetical protein [Rathayibacter sp. VKM Ac-2630]|uniref:hypothetical protein n=1 Tax=Rathayibacter sp. VKM Ac-2630 TaxID=1938617 RepID=UPI00111568CF|nr:hypothetical protein [Rathayibacter sp. VKM Ac-2630]
MNVRLSEELTAANGRAPVGRLTAFPFGIECTYPAADDAIVDALGWDPELIPDHDPGRPDPVLEMLYRDVFDVREYPDRVLIYRHHH